MVAANKRPVICRSLELIERGRGVRFVVRRRGEVTPAFAVRFHGIAHAYLNRCAHRSLELDWVSGEFFNAFGEHLLCATHGARYIPASGACVGGPCHGAGLVKLPLVEKNGQILLESGNDIHLVDSEDVA